MNKIGIVISSKESEVLVSTFKSGTTMELETLSPNIIVDSTNISNLSLVEIEQYDNDQEAKVCKVSSTKLNCLNISQLTHLNNCWKKRLADLEKKIRNYSKYEVKNRKAAIAGCSELLDETLESKRIIEEIESILAKLISARIGIVTYVGSYTSESAFVEVIDEKGTLVRDVYCDILGNDLFFPGEIVKIIDGCLYEIGNLNPEDIKTLSVLEQYHQQIMRTNLEDVAIPENIADSENTGEQIDINKFLGGSQKILLATPQIEYELFILGNIKRIMKGNGLSEQILSREM